MTPAGGRAAVDRLLPRLAREPQYPTQGATLFVDLERRDFRRAYTPRHVVETFLEGRHRVEIVMAMSGG